MSQFHKAYPAYSKTKVGVYVPWTKVTTEFTKALSSGKNAPDITEVGNTETPTDASLGMLANITSDVSRLVEQVQHRLRHTRQRHAERRHLRRVMVRRRPGHLLPHGPVQGGRDHLHPESLMKGRTSPVLLIELTLSCRTCPTPDRRAAHGGWLTRLTTGRRPRFRGTVAGGNGPSERAGLIRPAGLTGLAGSLRCYGPGLPG